MKIRSQIIEWFLNYTWYKQTNKLAKIDVIHQAILNSFNSFVLFISVIITQTVGQMTEDIPSTTMATQTPLPRTHLSFASLATKKNSQNIYKSSPFEQQILENELRLQTQRNAIKTIDSKLNDKTFGERISHQVNASSGNATPNHLQSHSYPESRSPSISVSTTEHVKVDKVATKMVRLIIEMSLFCLRFFSLS